MIENQNPDKLFVMENSNLDKGFQVKELMGGIIDFRFTRGSKTEEDSTAVAQGVAEEINKLLEKYQNKEALILVQLVEDDGIVSKEAKDVYDQFINDERIMKMAIFGGLKKYRMVAKMLIRSSNFAIKVFKDKGEAMHWLIRS